MAYWALSPEEALHTFGSSAGGLAAAEAERRLAEHGPNELEERGRAGPLVIFLRQFASPLIYILLVAVLVTVLLGEYLDSAVIGAVLLLNAVLGFTQEHRAERSMEALRRLARARARVVRDGREREIDAGTLVPGDALLLEAGAKVPADCRILHAVALEADESVLTGESATVAKSAAPVAPDAPVPERTGALFMGTVVTRGHCRALVAATERLARPDGDIEDELRNDVILRTLWISPSDLDISVTGGRVKIAGRLRAKADAELLEQFAWRVPGVVTVDCSKLGWPSNEPAAVR